jgi:hypothetical protein
MVLLETDVGRRMTESERNGNRQPCPAGLILPDHSPRSSGVGGGYATAVAPRKVRR